MRQIVLTCEHGGNEIPKEFGTLFKKAHLTLQSHRGWDIGALALAQTLHQALNIPLFYSTTSRLLVELNRSLHHPNLFSAYTKFLSSTEKEDILKRFYYPYRNEVEAYISNFIQQDIEVLHISVHSFTPVFDGIVRNADIGLLYDPTSKGEKCFCKNWKEQIIKNEPYRVRFNYPYKGTADGFTSYLRKKFMQDYLGIELEINQQLLERASSIEEVSQILITSLKASIL